MNKKQMVLCNSVLHKRLKRKLNSLKHHSLKRYQNLPASYICTMISTTEPDSAKFTVLRNQHMQGSPNLVLKAQCPADIQCLSATTHLTQIMAH